MLTVHDMIYEPGTETPHMLFDVTLSEKEGITFLHAIMRSMMLLNFDVTTSLGLDASYEKEQALFDYPINQRFFIKLVPETEYSVSWSSGRVVNGSYLKTV